MSSILKYNLIIQLQLKTIVITPTNSFCTEDLQEGQEILALQVVRVFLIPPRWRRKYMGACVRENSLQPVSELITLYFSHWGFMNTVRLNIWLWEKIPQQKEWGVFLPPWHKLIKNSGITPNKYMTNSQPSGKNLPLEIKRKKRIE